MLLKGRDLWVFDHSSPQQVLQCLAHSGPSVHICRIHKGMAGSALWPGPQTGAPAVDLGWGRSCWRWLMAQEEEPGENDGTVCLLPPQSPLADWEKGVLILLLFWLPRGMIFSFLICKMGLLHRRTGCPLGLWGRVEGSQSWVEMISPAEPGQGSSP